MCWPSLVNAAPSTDSLFLFVFVRGGWDPTFVFTDQINNSRVYTHPGSVPAQAHGINYVSHSLRPNVDRFFEEYGQHTCILNGIEIESLTHDACQRIIFTGQPGAGLDDWPALIGSQSLQDLPVMIVSGPSFTVEHAQSVVRCGEDGQLSKLLTGSVHNRSDQSISPLSSSSQDKVQAFLRNRIDDGASLGEGNRQAFYNSLQGVYDQRDNAGELLSLELGSATGFTPVPVQVEAAIPTLTSGLSRCIVIEHNGLYESGWDHHSSIDNQTYHYDLLFSDLKEIMDNLENWGGANFAQRVNIVVFSEMGRAPNLNAMSGKDHWTFSSAMVIGLNIQGGRVIGGYDDQLLGQPIDTLSGEFDAGGERISSKHFGATILTLAGIDSKQFVPADPILL